jgi:hypothetical protein
MSIRCTKFRPFQKNTLRGFVSLELTRVGLAINDCTLHENNGKKWIGLPARPYQGQDGSTKWTPVVEFIAGARHEADDFQRQALDAIDRFLALEPS